VHFGPVDRTRAGQSHGIHLADDVRHRKRRDRGGQEDGNMTKPPSKWMLLAGRWLEKWDRFAVRCRQSLLTTHLAACGRDVLLARGVRILTPNKVTIGDFSQIGENSFLSAGGEIRIGRWCQIANNVILVTGNHNLNGELYYDNVSYKDIRIGDNVWIASGAILVGGVTVGSNAVIGAGSVVTRDVPDYAVAVGVPAHVVRQAPRLSPAAEARLAGRAAPAERKDGA
jgi:maltose O-acetyltransferase